MDPGKIRMSVGGEGLESVMGRREEEELPEFGSGSFAVEGSGGEGSGGRLVDEEFLDRYLPRGAVSYHTMRGLVESMRVVEPEEFHCSQVYYYCVFLPLLLLLWNVHFYWGDSHSRYHLMNPNLRPKIVIFC